MEVKKLHNASPLLTSSLTNFASVSPNLFEPAPIEPAPRTLKCDQCEFVALSVRRSVNPGTRAAWFSKPVEVAFPCSIRVQLLLSC